ncbi:MAG: tRNA (adenosine(37)-N6)-threonylcarbamoyltransferase complex ATPase subunit type 1 TsaE [Candidatus Portnoybacteria bacterium CG03_land_8_20_14_0_80_41_10]|uniref:tRNA threonylcarbamoyladenosine biosynthesis protein TsaE n=1 Tax=Candidatus Portnoybacteria bacterium CG03_land_8_20_14_0_80_41_10 TaxID=1974808 RepID=A0A2M7BUI8_9BACT|nr:MAG: tRNA (adenosine(37)-N6)-threonylcarbamoyltransferase complex ATPase subunit type 1 TsaE [Candidatus Portnoybacteria bacterium CG03_land_8_20_14_0_80_41_10]
MNYLEAITESAQETQKMGQILAKKIIKSKAKTKKALIIGLTGELGSGKTTFVQGLAQGLAIKERITSPTFVIFKKFSLSRPAPFKYFYHIDCYRLRGSHDLIDLGFLEIINQPDNLVIIEWAEKARKILPANVSWLRFEHLAEDRRRIIYENLDSY